MTINRERVQLFINALRSGNYKQASGTLARKLPGEDWKYCCLGVACEVARQNGVEIAVTDRSEDYSTNRMYDNRLDILPQAVREWYGFEQANPTINVPRHCDSCEEIHMEDNGATYANDALALSFGVIADGFERTYLQETPE